MIVASYLCTSCRSERTTPAPFCYLCGCRRQLEVRVREVADHKTHGVGHAPPAHAGVDGGPAEGRVQPGDGPSDDEGMPQFVALGSVKVEKPRRLLTGIEGFDRVVGDEDAAGHHLGMAFSLAGRRGSGKSTMLLQACANLADAGVTTAYGLGEGETVRRVAANAARIGLSRRSLRGVQIMDLHDIEDDDDRIDYFLDACDALAATFIVVDSAQGFSRDPRNPRDVGHVVKTCMRYAATHGDCVIWMVGHLTAEGRTAGGETAQHLGDGVFDLRAIPRHDKRKIIHLRCDEKNRGGWDTEDAYFELSKHGISDYDPDEDDRQRERETRDEEKQAWRRDSRRSGPTDRSSTTGPRAPTRRTRA